MSLTKQAKVLSESQQKAVLAYLRDRPQAERNVVMFLLSFDAGLRAKEIAELQWKMLVDAEGKLTGEIRLPNSASKGASGGVIPCSKRLSAALEGLSALENGSAWVITSQRSKKMSAASVTQWFWHLYKRLGFEGCSSHSGRRTAITTWARKISTVGGSMKDVMTLARHSSLSMTQKYVEVNKRAIKLVVG